MTSTAEKILDAAEQEFAERGFEATSMALVAEQVGIRSPSLYNHFASKRALYAAVVERLMQRFDAILAAQLESAPDRDNMVACLNSVAAFFNENPGAAKLLLRAALGEVDQHPLLFERMVSAPARRLRATAAGADQGELTAAFMILHALAIATPVLGPWYRGRDGEAGLPADETQLWQVAVNMTQQWLERVSN